jgi:hypothetical protein
MSNWKYFFKHFPARVNKIFDAFDREALNNDVEVTFILTIAAAGFTVPFERLKKYHPSEDASRFASSTKELKKLLDKKFIGSKLWPDVDSKSWRYINKMKSINGNVEEWIPEISFALPLSKEKKQGFEDRRCNTILHHLRNALAHGNIFSFNDPITELIFLSSVEQSSSRNITAIERLLDCLRSLFGLGDVQKKNFAVLVVSPADFKTFLKNWFVFLETLEPNA